MRAFRCFPYGGNNGGRPVSYTHLMCSARTDTRARRRSAATRTRTMRSCARFAVRRCRRIGLRLPAENLHGQLPRPCGGIARTLCRTWACCGSGSGWPRGRWKKNARRCCGFCRRRRCAIVPNGCGCAKKMRQACLWPIRLMQSPRCCLLYTSLQRQRRFAVVPGGV